MNVISHLKALKVNDEVLHDKQMILLNKIEKMEDRIFELELYINELKRETSDGK